MASAMHGRLLMRYAAHVVRERDSGPAQHIVPPWVNAVRDQVMWWERRNVRRGRLLAQTDAGEVTRRQPRVFAAQLMVGFLQCCSASSASSRLPRKFSRFSSKSMRPALTDCVLGKDTRSVQWLRQGFHDRQWMGATCQQARAKQPFAALPERFGAAVEHWRQHWLLWSKLRTLPPHAAVTYRLRHRSLEIGDRGGRHNTPCVVCDTAMERHEHTLFRCDSVLRAWQVLHNMFPFAVDLSERLAFVGALKEDVDCGPLRSGAAATEYCNVMRKKWALVSAAFVYVVWRQYVTATRDMPVWEEAGGDASSSEASEGSSDDSSEEHIVVSSSELSVVSRDESSGESGSDSSSESDCGSSSESSSEASEGSSEESHSESNSESSSSGSESSGDCSDGSSDDSSGDSDDVCGRSDHSDPDSVDVGLARALQARAQHLMDTDWLLALWRSQWARVVNASMHYVGVVEEEAARRRQAAKWNRMFGFGRDFAIDVENGRWHGQWREHVAVDGRLW